MAVHCPHGQVNANEVLWIGDSWILVTGSQHTRVRDLARAAGAIGADDDYVIGAVAASTMATIANQYATREAGATKVKVVIMDGGTWDTIVANGSDASVNSVVNTFGQFLTQVASDGTVEHIIYFLLPELPGIPGVAALRPLLQQACAAERGAVPLPRPAAALDRPPTTPTGRRDSRPDGSRCGRSSPTPFGPSCNGVASRNEALRRRLRHRCAEFVIDLPPCAHK